MVLVCLLPALAWAAQETPPEATFFSGTVVAVNANEVTVRRRALVSNETTRTFQIDSTTKVQGKLRLKADVTVRYVADDKGNCRAVSIIVR
jgi:hypothetical protein